MYRNREMDILCRKFLKNMIQEYILYNKLFGTITWKVKMNN